MNRFLAFSVRASFVGALLALASCSSSKSVDNGVDASDGTGGSGGSGGSNTGGSGGSGVGGSGGSGAGGTDGGTSDGSVSPVDATTVDAPVDTGPAATPCTTDGNCAAPTGYCDTTAGVCVQCLGDANCASNNAAPVCNTATHKCVQCTDSGACGGNFKYCNTTTDHCVECLDTPNCGSSTRACDQAIDRCVATCTGDNDCRGLNSVARHCDTTKGFCVECGADTDCNTGFVCKEGHCGCAGSATRCGNSCVDTQNSPTRCGDCSTSCADSEYCSAGTCACRPGLTMCGNTCVTLSGNPAHCGTCDTKCAAGQMCQAGACVGVDAGANPCGDGLHSCPAAGNTVACFDTEKSPTSCGGCGLACNVDELCVAGHCRRYNLATGCTTCPCTDVCKSGLNAIGCCPGQGTSTQPVCVDEGPAVLAGDGGSFCP